MKGQFDNGAPIFQQIVEQMLQSIARGTLAPGQKVDSVRILAQEYKVNPNTMQKSLEKLGDMGFLYTERTSGRFVTEDATKIEQLRNEIPTKMTAAYVADMLDFGVESSKILNYVKEHLYGANSGN
ncbi:MAG: GntR family transcriptional regulator [Defluviitaleaceae bacterium]|nr:GntR family transcriptional regulator [Defluviitaleaceae bacterium]